MIEKIDHYNSVVKNNKVLMIAPLIFMVSLQIIWIISAGFGVTKIGLFILLLQSIVYLICINWVLPDLFEKRHYLKFCWKLIALIFLYILLRALILFKGLLTEDFWGILFSVIQVLYASQQLFLVLGTSLFVGFYRQNQINALKREVSLKASLEAITELRRLESIIYQMQLNPHFLFNTLNTIRLETANPLPNVSRVVELLAIILKGYLADPMQGGKVNIEGEIEIVECYTELQSYLKGKNNFVIFKADLPEISTQNIPQGILLALIENVYKYGIINEEEYPATIIISLFNSHFSLYTWNLKRISTLKGNGLGQKNVRVLLEHYYPNNFSFNTNDTDDFYELKLEIEL